MTITTATVMMTKVMVTEMMTEMMVFYCHVQKIVNWLGGQRANVSMIFAVAGSELDPCPA